MPKFREKNYAIDYCHYCHFYRIFGIDLLQEILSTFVNIIQKSTLIRIIVISLMYNIVHD